MGFFYNSRTQCITLRIIYHLLAEFIGETQVKSTITLLLLCSFSLSAFAQEGAETNRAMMKKVDWGLGRWEGKGWIESSSAGKLAYTSTSTVQSKLQGLVFLFEGKSQFRRQGDDSNVINSSQISILSYDPKKECYRLQTYVDDGKYAENEMKYEDHTFRWEKRDEERGVTQRFTSHLDDGEHLIYTGEVLKDRIHGTSFSMPNTSG